jgi:hypothetical protein
LGVLLIFIGVRLGVLRLGVLIVFVVRCVVKVIILITFVILMVIRIKVLIIIVVLSVTGIVVLTAFAVVVLGFIRIKILIILVRTRCAIGILIFIVNVVLDVIAVLNAFVRRRCITIELLGV